MSIMQPQFAQRGAPYQQYNSSYGSGTPSFDRRAGPPNGSYPQWSGGMEAGGGGFGHGYDHDDDMMKPPSPTPTLSGIKRLTAKVRPMLEANGVFEVSLIGNSMLPMTKRIQELVALAQKLPPAEAGTLPQEVARFSGHPDMLARAFELFLNRGLASDLQTRNDSFKTFLGLHLAYDTDHFRANVDGTVTRGRPPLRPQNVQDVEAMDLAASQQAESARREARDAADAASADEKAAALELIKQRRAAKMSAKQPAPAPASVVQAPPEPSFSSASYSAALSATDKLISSYTHAAPKQPPASEPAEAPVPGAKRALKQAEAIMQQVDFKTELRTWISSQDKDGYTFTQSISGGMMDVDIVPVMSAMGVDTSAGGAKSSGSSTASAGAAPTPMEASGSSTASRVAAIAGHTNSFRDIKRKFAGNANVTDQEYESSLSNLPSAAPFSDQNKAMGTAEDRGGNVEGAFKPNQGIIQALIKVMRTCGEQKDVVRAATALCNLSCDSAQNREIAFKEEAVAVLCDLLSLESSTGELGGRVHEVAAACLSNLAGYPPAKKAIAEANGLTLLQQVLCGTNLSAASQAAGALWALCVDGDDIKGSIATAAVVRTLIRLLDTEVATRAGFSHSQRTELQSRVAGCISEVCIRNPTVKSKIGSAGAIPELINVCKGDDITCQRLAAQGLCNLVANHHGNKRLAKKNSLIREMAEVLKSTQVMEIQCACASVIFNVACKSDKEELEALEILSQLRSIKNSRNIDVRLMCVTNSVGEAQSPAFGTF